MRPRGVFDDPGEGVRGLFMTGPAALPRLELLENLPGSTTLSPWLRRQVRVYHMAFTVADIEAASRRLAGQHRALMVGGIRPCTCFARICFMALPGPRLIELIEP